MTLRDKFRKADRFSVTKISLDVKCEKIADDYAIEFAEWCFKLGVYEYLNDFKNKTTKELLEIFKKDKGL